MRLDIFLPFLRKESQGVASQPAILQRLARRLLPKSFLADPINGTPGRIRKWLQWLGPSWLSSPLRRAIQVACFLVFLWLFFYVCWPYSAQPARSWPSWTLIQFDAASGEAVLSGTKAATADLRPGMVLHVTDESIVEEEHRYVGRFRIRRLAQQQLHLRGDEPLSDAQRELLSFSPGPWTLHASRPGWPSHYADDLKGKEKIPAESMLIIDPLVSLSTALAARSWVWSLTFAAGILLAGVLIPRGFCGYICPLGTVIDLFDWAVGRRITRWRVADDGWWVHIKYYLLLGLLVSSLFGVLASGYFAAIPVLTRGLLFLCEPLQTGMLRGWHQVPAINIGHVVSILLFLAVLGLGWLQPRFWCKYVCPSGAVFSVGNLFRATERKVESTCIHCDKCVEICPFDAIKPDFTTRTSDCTLCQTCGGVCPTYAIKFVDRCNREELKQVNEPPTGETVIGRRGFLSLAAGTAAAVAGGAAIATVTKGFGARLGTPSPDVPVRPPGSVPEQLFLQLCIRCGACFKACPNNVLQSMGFEQGLEGLWTPRVVADWAGCESSCNACGQVCPTGAIRALPLAEKKVARMGLAIVNEDTCLPFAGREACQLCVDECNSAGYYAIEFTRVHTEVDEQGQPLEGTGFLAPVVLADKCVGCGLCQTRCYGINVDEKQLLAESAIVIEAGSGKEDRMMHGSYISLRETEAAARAARQQQQTQAAGGAGYLPDFLKPSGQADEQ